MGKEENRMPDLYLLHKLLVQVWTILHKLSYLDDLTSDAISSSPRTCRSFSCLIKSHISGSSSSRVSWPVQIVALTTEDR